MKDLLCTPSGGAFEDLLADVLAAVPVTTVLLDDRGVIRHVNAAWREFAEANGADAATTRGVGLSYLDVCCNNADPLVVTLGAWLKHPPEHPGTTLDRVYSCHGPTELRWFRVRGRWLESGRGLLVTHTDVTAEQLACAHVAIANATGAAHAASLPLAEVARALAETACRQLSWEFGAVWLPYSDGHLRCVWSFQSGDAALDGVERHSVSARIAYGEGLVGRVWASGDAEWWPNMGAAPREERDDLYAEGRLVSAFACKLGTSDAGPAVLELRSRVQRSEDPTLLRICHVVTRQGSARAELLRAQQSAAADATVADAARKRLEAMLLAAPAIIAAVDMRGRVQYLSRPSVYLSAGKFVGAHLLELTPPADQAAVGQRLELVLSTGASQTWEGSLRTKAGRRWYLVDMSPMRDGDLIIGCVVTVQDMTVVKTVQGELHSAQRLAALGTLTAGIAHELNTPIQFVTDSVTFLREAANEISTLLSELLEVQRLALAGTTGPPLKDAARRAAEVAAEVDLDYHLEHVPGAFARCLDGLRRVGSIVRSMKEFSHPGEHTMAPVDLNRAIHSTLVIAGTEHKYVAELVERYGELPPVTCDIGDINQVVLNVVVNASHAIGAKMKDSGEMGTISVETAVESEMVRISISDTGLGMSDEVAERVYEPFFTTKGIGLGTGQGLPFAWRVVKEQHGGELSFDTVLGEGTTFHIRLPIAGKQRPPAVASLG